MFFHLLLKSAKEIMVTYSCEIHSHSSGVDSLDTMSQGEAKQFLVALLNEMLYPLST